MRKGSKSKDKAVSLRFWNRLLLFSQWVRARSRCVAVATLASLAAAAAAAAGGGICLLLAAASLLRRPAEVATWSSARDEARSSQDSLPVWVWWDYYDKPPEHMPGIIEACRRALQQRSWPHSAFKIQLVTHSTIWKELPDLPAAFDSLPKHVPTMLADVAGPGLIAKYGGIFMHSDVLLSGNLTWMENVLRAEPNSGGDVADFIGHAEKGQDCQQGEIGSVFFAGRPGNIFAQEWYETATKVLRNSCQVRPTTTTTPGSNSTALHSGPRYVPQDFCKNVSSASFGEALFRPILKRILLSRPPQPPPPRPKPDSSDAAITASSGPGKGNFRLACLSEDVHHQGIQGCASECLEYLADHADSSKWLDKDKVPKSLPPVLFHRFAHHLDVTTLKGGLLSIHYETLIRSRALLAELVRQSLRLEPVSRFGGLVSLCYSQVHAPTLQEHPYRPVHLVHIPRTGGTSMEMCTRNELDNDERWGRENKLLQQLPQAGSGHDQIPCVGQHVPPSLTDFYLGKETFCVVRHPYDRLISIFGFQQGMFHRNEHCDQETLNKDVVEFLERYSGNDEKDPEPYMFDCHMLPQSAYVFGWDADERKVKTEVRGCTNMLTYGKQKSDLGDLGKVFDNFMLERGYPYRLHDLQRAKARPNQQVSHQDCRALTPAHLSESTKKKIQEVYADDFRLLGFEP